MPCCSTLLDDVPEFIGKMECVLTKASHHLEKEGK
jgi:hypothetical protein